MDKSQLRREARRRRRGLDAVHRHDAQLAITQVLDARCRRDGWRSVAAYAATASEASLASWFDTLETPGTRVPSATRLFLPAIDADGVMTFREWAPGRVLVDGPFGIAQPEASAPAIAVPELDAMLLPLLGFDHAGTRLGSGAGYYDRALAPLTGATQRPRIVGIAFAAQRFDALPRDPWDVPLDAVVTEEGWLDLPV
jgi:5-formyltetrahydrofolate cyclo-ligase